MLRFVTFDLSLFNRGDDKTLARTDLTWLLEALTRRDQAYLVDHPDTPLLYQSGVVYERPAQFGGECEEVAALRAALGSKAKEPQIAAILDLIQQVLGGERFRDIGRIIENGKGDCLPIETLVRRYDKDSFIDCPIGEIKVGDVLSDKNSNKATVTKVWERSQKPTLTFYLSNKKRLISSLDHRHMVTSFDAVRADRLRVGDILKIRDSHVEIVGIEPSRIRECVDITTSTGTFWLPESDVVTHNCDNVATWRAAELRQNGIEASPYIVWRRRLDGGYTYHVVVRWPDNSLEDPSLLLGMGGADRKADRDEQIRANAERVEMVKAAAARKNAGKSTPSLDSALSSVEDVLGSDHNRGLGPWSHGNIPDEFIDFDENFDDDYDSRVLAHTGLLRGR